MSYYDYLCKKCNRVKEVNKLGKYSCCQEDMQRVFSPSFFFFKKDYATKDFHLLKGKDKDSYIEGYCGGDLFK